MTTTTLTRPHVDYAAHAETLLNAFMRAADQPGRPRRFGQLHRAAHTCHAAGVADSPDMVLLAVTASVAGLGYPPRERSGPRWAGWHTDATTALTRRLAWLGVPRPDFGACHQCGRDVTATRADLAAGAATCPTCGTCTVNHPDLVGGT